MKDLPHERLKFIDETGVTTTLTRRFGRAAAGQRVVEAVPRNDGQPTTVLSLLGVSGVEATLVVEGAVDTLVLEASCQEVLRPCLRAGAIVVVDNLGAHRASGSEAVARACGARVIWLPPYSPAFSPIEPMWSKLKSYLRRVKARTLEELDRAIAEGLRLLTADDCLGWFQHCGYQVAQN